MSSAEPLTFPAAPAERLSQWQIAATLRRNVLAGFTRQAFEEEVVVRRLFGHHQFVLNRPASIRHVLIDNAANYARSFATVRLLYPVIGRGLFLAEGEDWRERRRTVAPAFAPRTMPILARHVAAAAQEAVVQLAAARAPVDLFEAMQRLAIEIAGRSMFSLEMAELGPRLRALLRDYSLRHGRPTVLDIVLPPAIPVPRDFGRWRFRRRWLALIGDIITARRALGDAAAPRDLLDLLASDPETGAAVPAARLADEVATMIAAGHATTAVALFWALFLVATIPAAQEHIAAEAAGLDLGPAGAAEALSRLAYTRAVVQETLRLYPPAYSIVRRARRADEAGGVPVPAGAVVNIAPWVLHRHRRLWSEPERFDPSRFLPGATPPDRFAYLPFGAGPRICVGAQFALTEAVLVLARLVQAFRIERTGNEPVEPVAAITIQPDHAPTFRLTPRGQAPCIRGAAPPP